MMSDQYVFVLFLVAREGEKPANAHAMFARQPTDITVCLLIVSILCAEIASGL